MVFVSGDTRNKDQVFVTTPVYRTLDPAQPQSDVIQLFPSSPGSGLSTLLSNVVMLISPVSALLRWDFVSIM